MGPTTEAVARAALSGLLSANLELFGVAIDRCYASDPGVAAGYFTVSACLPPCPPPLDCCYASDPGLPPAASR
jgi:hypothetical protein